MKSQKVDAVWVLVKERLPYKEIPVLVQYGDGSQRFIGIFQKPTTVDEKNLWWGDLASHVVYNDPVWWLDVQKAKGQS